MKKSIAKIVSRKVLVMLLIAVVFLYIGAYFAVSKIVMSDAKKHARTIVGIYSDLSTYTGENKDTPITELSDDIKVFGDYMCNWYKIDAAAIYIPTFIKNEVKYIAFSANDRLIKHYNQIVPKSGDVIEYKFTPEEKDVWQGEKEFAYIPIRSGTNRELMTVYCSTDNFNNKFFVAVTTNYTEIYKESLKYFLIFALFIGIVLAGIYWRLFYITKRKVSDPAAEISSVMNAAPINGRKPKISVNDIDSQEFLMIALSYNVMLDELHEYVQSISELTNEQMRQTTELEVASRIQQGFLPKNTINSNDYYIQCMMRPAKNIGGDLYDYIELDNNRTLMIIADVSGKGMPAAIMMAVTLILVREYAKLDLSPAEILERANNTLSEKNPAMLFVTAFVGIYDRRTKTFTYANAGHNLPYIISNELKAVENNLGTVLGLFKDESYENNSVQLKTGDTIFMYTDGVPEVINDDKKFYGEDRLKETLQKFTTSSSANIVEDVYQSVRDFSGDAEQFDDLTMLTLTVKDTVVLSLDYDIKEFEKIKALIMELPLERQQMLNICLAAEEIFANKCEHTFPNGVPEGEKITFALSQADMIILRFEDGGEKFNPLENIPDVDDYDPDTQMGGLGMFITSNIVDDIRYNYTDNKNIISLIKYYEEDK